jgi:DDE family transposase
MVQLSVDTKKKEVVGNLANKGREWQPKGESVRVDVHNFPDPKVGKAIPYGVYDVGANQRFVSVGADADTAAFAVATIRRWWDTVGSLAYPRRAGCSSPPTPGDPTGTAAGCGTRSLDPWPSAPGWRSPSATSRLAPASGTASSTACSATSP